MEKPISEIASKDALVVNSRQYNATEVCTSGITDIRGCLMNSFITGFNKNITHWDTGSVTDMDFYAYIKKSESIINQPL